MASYWTSGRGYTAVLCYIPAILGEVLVNILSSHNKVGLLFGYWVSSKDFPLSLFSIISPYGLSFCYRALPNFPWMDGIPCSRPHEAYVHLRICVTSLTRVWIGTTANAIVMCAYAVGNAVGPFMWKKQYQPRFVSFIFVTLVHQSP